MLEFAFWNNAIAGVLNISFMSIQSRTKVLQSYGASPSEIAELLTYNETIFDRSQINESLSFPLEPESHLATWEDYLKESERSGVFPTLKSKLIQWQFPIAVGMSERANYRAATRKGKATDGMPEATGLVLQEPNNLQLEIYESLAGKIPVLTVGCRSDFAAIIQALTQRNEPQPIPDSMGAITIAGYNNWDRIRAYRHAWETEKSQPATELQWKLEFKRLTAQKDLYQDKFIVLSSGGYSGVSAAEMGMGEEEWLRVSHQIRLAHECTHYFTRRLLGAMHNNLMDELMADYQGIVAGNNGEYRADWFLRFLGMENFPEYRDGGRLQNYRGNPELSDGAFRILQGLVKDAAENLEQFQVNRAEALSTPAGQCRLLIALSQLTLEDIAHSQDNCLSSIVYSCA
ncbi:DUF7005 family protein [Roseofilum casamattae]|uniref:Uncharacterized protein n=1 Tax=Roseofilum casamattae BLCC-M143 TaxID=3022442 RepID=A0ABT7C0T6_9CYAN|nr:hypothetical protein [Roseofilum casamattae]MDJ1184354.1 hypothetical protein [Roseofilum casamattae BLCC-M143]